MKIFVKRYRATFPRKKIASELEETSTGMKMQLYIGETPYKEASTRRYF